MVEQVRETKDYSKFKFVKGNRKEIDRRHVNMLKSEILEEGYRCASIVVVDKNMTIIDGQHRFIACQELGMPILYMMDKNATDKTIIKINTTQKKWSALDYINYYAERGNYSMMQVLYFMDKYKLDSSSTAFIMDNKRRGSSLTKDIRNGSEFFRKQDVYVATERFEKIIKFCDITGLPKCSRLITALLTASNDKNFSYDILIQKASKAVDKAYQCSTVVGYVMMIQDLYNRFNSRKIDLTKYIK